MKKKLLYIILLILVLAIIYMAYAIVAFNKRYSGNSLKWAEYDECVAKCREENTQLCLCVPPPLQ